MIITKEGFAVIERDSHLGKWVIEHKMLDFDQNALPTYLPYFKPGGTLINIGANIGCYAYAFRNLAKEIHCFEPNPEALECLFFNMNAAGCSNVAIHPWAVSDVIDYVNVISENDNIGMAYVEQSATGSTRCVNIDHFEFKSCDMILIDCEGFELKALIGAEITINRCRPIMVIEINDHTLARTKTSRHQIFKWLTDHNYTFRNIYKEQGLEGDQLDIICFPD